MITGPHRIAPGVHLLRAGRTAVAPNVYLLGSGTPWVLVDAAWAGSAEAVTAAAESLFGRGTTPAAIVLTHIHPDHCGAAGALARTWRVPAYVHPAELPMAAGRYLPEYPMPLDRWLVAPLMRLLPRRTRARIEQAGDITDVVRPLEPGGGVPGLPDWQWVHTPGHTPGHVAYLRRSDGVLITGDAAATVDLNSVTGVLTGRQRPAGPPRYTTWNWPAAVRSVAALAALEPRILAPGHGLPLTTGTAGALHHLARQLDRPRAGRLRRLRTAVAAPRYGGAGPYRPPPPLYARLQWIGHALTRLRLSPRSVVTLEVPGRRSGVVRRTNLVLLDHDGEQYLLSLAGQSQWARNVRAAGGHAVLARGRRRRAVTLVEVPVPARADIVRAYLLRGGRQPGHRKIAREADMYFGLTGEPTPAELAAVAPRYPVFHVTDTAPHQP
ncbi:Zn-dependent oxidoreductase [Rhodococcus ruber BKS 20-38]|uniref:Zn-dependent oxidoreductase n=1 Tax=Rhodococcus ruber BKS 20-38 TaxID=1278076 RepID=M2YQ91_9NOCA|nr:nitroreductase/quinone reductase family protein [Rhodococcus ruber]EME64115.1 Zn-dependent oxidoreductase [Rhodococcus ruber BKS 20-38]